VTAASATVDGAIVGRIGPGLLALVGVSKIDEAADAEALGSKLAGLRIFADENGLMNRSVQESGGQVLIVSQFTLYGDLRRGRRPSFTEAALAESAAPLLDTLCQVVRARGITVSEGLFGAHMQVELVNDGPVTLVIETRGGKVV
jgi:D-tyrosyl-tRNA(Tyr) deacylase